MPRKPKPEKPDADVAAPIPAEVLDQIVRDGPLTAAEVETATRRFMKALIERALGAELSLHLGYRLGGAKPEFTTNHRNGTSGKTVLTDDGRTERAHRDLENRTARGSHSAHTLHRFLEEDRRTTVRRQPVSHTRFLTLPVQYSFSSAAP